MSRTLFAMVAGVAMLAFAGAANAQEPLQLTNAQMDNVTAGATSIGVGFGGAIGTLLSGGAVNIHTAVIGSSAFAIGDVTTVAGSWAPGPGAAAFSSLSLGVTSP